MPTESGVKLIMERRELTMMNNYWMDLTILTIGAILITIWIEIKGYDKEDRKK